MGEKHFELTDETAKVYGNTLYRIRATRDSKWAKKGELGGFVESVDNLSDNAWVSDNAKVFENARVSGNARVLESAWVYGDARVLGNAWVYGKAQLYGSALVFGKARVYGGALVHGKAQVHGNAEVSGDARLQTISDYVVFKNFWSSGRYFTWTRSNDKWLVGCFHGTGKELIENAYRDSEVSGKNYEVIVNYVENVVKPQFNK